MALTAEVIKANEALATLTEPQIAAISTLSANDEQTVINTKIGELHGQYDKDVKEVTGIDKAEGEKTYNYVKRVLGDFKAKVGSSTELQTKITGYETKIATMEKAIAEGKGNETMVQKLKDTESQLTALQAQYQTDKQTWDGKEKEFATKITGIQIDTEFDKVKAGLKFKPGYPESIQKTLLKSATDNVLSQFKPDWVEANGERTMVFRDSKGEIARNKNNALNPYTAAELLKEGLKEVLDLGVKKTGTGTTPDKTVIDTVDLVDISAAKTQVQADAVIAKYLFQNGETRGTQSFAEKQKKIREENGVNKLPIR